MKHVTLLIVMILSLTGCGEDRDIVDPGPQYLPQTSPENVIKNLVASYNWRDIDGYAALFADDFQYYFDEGSRQESHELPIFWTRIEDIEAARRLFECKDITDIQLILNAGNLDPKPVNDIDRDGWVYIDILHLLLEVEKAPDPGETEGVTFRVDNVQFRFYLRKGLTSTDTGSETWYLVEWRDCGTSETPGGVTGQAVEAATWAEIRALCQ